MTIENVVKKAEQIRIQRKAPELFAVGFAYGFIEAYSYLLNQMADDMKILQVSADNLDKKKGTL